jgi:hypothetical protein
MSSADEQARRAARASWPGLKTTLAEAPGTEDLSATTTAEQHARSSHSIVGAMSIEAGLNPDFLDLLAAFSRANVEFIVVGAHALAANGVGRRSR